MGNRGSSDFGCEFSGEQEYVTNSNEKNTFKLHLRKYPNLPQIMELEKEIDTKLTFNLYQTGKYKIDNVIGLKSKSRFWEYVSLNTKYPISAFAGNQTSKWIQPTNFSKATTRFTQNFSSSSNPIQPMLSWTSLKYNRFRSVKLVYGNISPLNKELVFSLNEPFIFKILPVDYTVLVEEIKK